MKSLSEYLINEKFKINKDIKNVSAGDEPFDTNKNDEGKISEKQRSLVNIFADAIQLGRSVIKRKPLYKGIKINYNILADLAGVEEIEDGDSCEDFFSSLRTTLDSVISFVEDNPEELKYAFPDFDGMSIDKIKELADIINKSSKLIAALNGNYLHNGDVNDGDYVQYDHDTGEYSNLDIVWDY